MVKTFSGNERDRRLGVIQISCGRLCSLDSVMIM